MELYWLDCHVGDTRNHENDRSPVILWHQSTSETRPHIETSQMSTHPWRVPSVVMDLDIFIVKVLQIKQVSFILSPPLHLLLTTGWHGKVSFSHVRYLLLATFSRGRLKRFLVQRPSYYPIGSGVYCPHFPNQNCHQQIRWSRVLRHTHP